MSFRKLRILIDRFPPESATWTAVREATPPEQLAAIKRTGHGPWSRLEQLVARSGDIQQETNWLFARMWGKGASDSPPPPLDRPGVGFADLGLPDNVTPLLNPETRAYFEAKRRSHGAG